MIHALLSLMIQSGYRLICLAFLFTMIQELTLATPVNQLSLTEVENKIEEAQVAIDLLPLRMIRESGGTLGARPYQNRNRPSNAWIEIDLRKQKTFDAVVLVPVVMLDDQLQSYNYAFPEQFQIRSYSSSNDKIGTLLYDTTKTPLATAPDRSPIIIQLPETTAQRIRFTPLTPLFQNKNIQNFFYTLSEFLVFNQNQNIALGSMVRAGRWTRHSPIWHNRYLTDGFMPYSEPSISTGLQEDVNGCRMYVDSRKPEPARVTLDLGSQIKVNEVRLYPLQMDQNSIVFHRAALGFPKALKIEVSQDASFSQSKVVYKSGPNGYLSPGRRVACFSGKETTGRYVRVTALELPPHPHRTGYIFAFSEIEVLSEGVTVSIDAPVELSHPLDITRYSASMLVDGSSSYGKILPMREWLEGLAKRNELEHELTVLESEREARYLKQTHIIRALQWGVGGALAITILVYMWQRLVRQRHIYKLRETLAADLHDEIGGNFSGIALLSEELAQESDMPIEHASQLNNITEISRKSASDARSLVRFLESPYIAGELLSEMKSTANLLLATHSFTFDVTGRKYIKNIEPKEKWHLLLFFKEALNNITKHAEATEVKITFSLTSRDLTLSIKDNGLGLPATSKPSHLNMRAQKLRADLNISTPSEGGTLITLKRKI